VLGRLVSKLEHKQKEWRTKRIERKWRFFLYF
jgi:hypothetical protein